MVQGRTNDGASPASGLGGGEACVDEDGPAVPEHGPKVAIENERPIAASRAWGPQVDRPVDC